MAGASRALSSAVVMVRGTLHWQHGHVLALDSHRAKQCLWNLCMPLHGMHASTSPTPNSSRQILQHDSSPPSVIIIVAAAAHKVALGRASTKEAAAGGLGGRCSSP